MASSPSRSRSAAHAGTASRGEAGDAGERPAIEVRGLTVRYPGLTAVDDVSFTVPAGRLVALLGPNGAGKTSTVETLEGYRRPAAGTVRVLGLEPGRDHAELTRRVGVMPQDGGVYTGIRAGEAVRLFAAYHDDPLDPDALLARVGLADRAGTTWRHLSGGERQRLSLALALVGRPDLVFLDEPTAGIDPAGRQLIRTVIAGLRRDGVTVVLTTHDLDEAEALADRVVIMDRGRVVADGTPDELRRDGGDGPIRFAAPPGLDTASLGGAVGGPVEETAAGEYRADVAPTPAAIAALTAWLARHDLPLADLRAGRQRLEDVFLRLTAEPSAADPGAAIRGPGAGRAGGRATTREARRTRRHRRRRP